MILLMVSSGVRIGALASMQKGDLTKIEFQGSILYKIQVYARTRDKYYTFCTPECYVTLQEYLNLRSRYGEQLEDKSPLFRRSFNKLDPFTINVPKFLTNGAVMKIVDEVLKKSGVKTSEAMRSLAFRKFFVTQCESTSMKSLHVSLLAGHDIGVKKRYYKHVFKEAEVLSDFMLHACDALTIDPTQRLRRENADLRMGQNAESQALWKKQKEQEARIKTLEDWLRTAGLMDSCD